MAYRYCTIHDINYDMLKDKCGYYIADDSSIVYFGFFSDWQVRIQDHYFVDLCGDVPHEFLKDEYLKTRSAKLKCSCCIFR